MVKNYTKGKQIKSLDELIEQDTIIFEADLGFRKVYSNSWFVNWTLSQTLEYIKQNKLFEALK